MTVFAHHHIRFLCMNLRSLSCNFLTSAGTAQLLREQEPRQQDTERIGGLVIPVLLPEATKPAPYAIAGLSQLQTCHTADAPRCCGTRTACLTAGVRCGSVSSPQGPGAAWGNEANSRCGVFPVAESGRVHRRSGTDPSCTESFVAQKEAAPDLPERDGITHDYARFIISMVPSQPVTRGQRAGDCCGPRRPSLGSETDVSGDQVGGANLARSLLGFGRLSGVGSG